MKFVNVKISIVIIIASFLLTTLNSCSNNDITKFDPVMLNKELIKKAEQTKEKLKTTPASWLTAVTIPNSPNITVKTKVFNDKKWVEMSVGIYVICRIIMKDGLWYVTDSDNTHKIYKPFTAPLKVIASYVFLRHSTLHFLEVEIPNLTLKGLTSDTVIFNTPAPSGLKENVSKVSSKLKEEPLNPVHQLDRKLQNGIPLYMHRQYGFRSIVQGQSYSIEIKKFKWHNNFPQDTFATDNEKWEDCTESILQSDLNDLLLVSYNPLHKFNASNEDASTNIINVKTGRYLRLPFKYGTTIFSCFSKDRKKVYTNGIDMLQGRTDIYEIDLLTGDNRNLTQGHISLGITVGATLSPDGELLAFIHKDFSTHILDSQIYLLELKTNQIYSLGEPSNAFKLNWLPDGEGLIYRRNIQDGSKYGKQWIYHMDLEGTATPIIEGDSPVLLDNGKQILFESDELWYTCDIHGKNVKLYADGMKKHGFPTLSPDGKQILFMHFFDDKLPIPTIYNVGESEGTVLSDAPGLWVFPSWR